MTGIDSFELMVFVIILYLLIVLVPSGLVFFIINKFLNKKPKFLAIYLVLLYFPFCLKHFFYRSRLSFFLMMRLLVFIMLYGLFQHL